MVGQTLLSLGASNNIYHNNYYRKVFRDEMARSLIAFFIWQEGSALRANADSHSLSLFSKKLCAYNNYFLVHQFLAYIIHLYISHTSHLNYSDVYNSDFYNTHYNTIIL